MSVVDQTWIQRGVWIAVGTVTAGSPMAWTFAGLVPTVVGSISLYTAVSGVEST
jgi:hypothetical protein